MNPINTEREKMCVALEAGATPSDCEFVLQPLKRKTSSFTLSVH